MHALLMPSDKEYGRKVPLQCCQSTHPLTIGSCGDAGHSRYCFVIVHLQSPQTSVCARHAIVLSEHDLWRTEVVKSLSCHMMPRAPAAEHAEQHTAIWHMIWDVSK